jgi:phenylpyruvate tautomerase PptA (4-oxalocrotonate tautomerase family)
MQQVEFLIVRVRLRRNDVADEKAMTWGDLPAQAKAAVIEHVAEMLRAHLERNASVEVDDE